MCARGGKGGGDSFYDLIRPFKGLDSNFGCYQHSVQRYSIEDKNDCVMTFSSYFRDSGLINIFNDSLMLLKYSSDSWGLAGSIFRPFQSAV